MLLCKEKARREGKLFDLGKYEREIRNATTSEELQAVINKYDEYFVFEKERALTDTEFDSFAKANPEMRAQNRTAADFYIQEKVVWHKESLLQDKKEGMILLSLQFGTMLVV